MKAKVARESTLGLAETRNGNPWCIAATCDTYSRILQMSNDVTRSPAAFTGLVTTAPVAIAPGDWARFVTRNQILRRWQRTCLSLLGASMDGEICSSIAESLLDHLPLYCGWEHHRRLLRVVDTPVFFRTDQAADGTVLEVQCPGSLWGVHEILREFYVEAGSPEATALPSLSAGFVRSLTDKLGAEPVVHHLLDNSSHPAGERFFIQRARRGAAYFGFDAVRPQDCNFVRSHDFFSLLNENFASQRLQRVNEGKPAYDLPPISLFDQKLLLVFPFWDRTRDHFDDEVRSLFPYSTLLAPGGLRIAEGDWLTLEAFANLPRNSRNYFLKYAGTDVARNWGSRAVYHLGKLSRAACLAKLKEVIEPYAAGERWIVQQEVRSCEDVSFLTREGGVETSTGHSKHSIFYGPGGPLGALSMFEEFYKVHGSSDTVTTIAVPAVDQTQVQSAHASGCR